MFHFHKRPPIFYFNFAYILRESFVQGLKNDDPREKESLERQEENPCAKNCNKEALSSVIKSHFAKAAKRKILKYFN